MVFFSSRTYFQVRKILLALSTGNASTIISPLSLGEIIRAKPEGISMIALKRITKTYDTGSIKSIALQGIDLHIDAGEFVAVMGPSGSGKSTMLHIIGCLDKPTSGEYYLDGDNVSQTSETQLAEIRNLKIGFIFQGFNLLPRTTAIENVELPLIYAGINSKERRRRALSALKAVGLGNRVNHTSKELSGEQQQRVAIARALINTPSVILADEPTGNLDTQSSKEVMSILEELNQKGNTILLVTHERAIADYTNRVIHFRDGRIIRED